MRTRRNETLADSPEASADGAVRTCVLTRAAAPRAALVRLALAPDGAVLPDVRGKAPGRGAWIAVDRAALDAAVAKGRLRGALARAFKGAALSVPDDLGMRVAQALERAALDRLGLEARAGNLATGAERIEAAARAGKLRALYHAADAGADGRGKLAQAWRVGSDEEGSGREGLALPVDRTILALALGRENVVHIGVIDRAAAERLSQVLDRWLHFIGSDPLPASCAPAAQGASAPRFARAQQAATTDEDHE